MKVKLSCEEIKVIVIKYLSDEGICDNAEPQDVHVITSKSGAYEDMTLEFEGFEIDMDDIEV